MILAGKAPPERKLAIVAGGAGLEPHVRAELLAVLAKDKDEKIAARAQNSLITVPLEVFMAAATMLDVAALLCDYIAVHLADKAGLADVLSMNPACPPKTLARLVPRLSPSSIAALLENLDRLSSSPDLAGALLSLPSLTAEQKKTIEELRRETDPAVLMKALEGGEPELQKRVTLLQKLAGMGVVERMQLALKGNREERLALIRDPNRMVQRAVLQSPRITDQEIENFAAMANLSEEVLRLIAANRTFIKNYVVVRNLLNNPKTSIDITLHLLPRLIAQDLKNLCGNKNIPETLRTTAVKLQRQRKEKKPGG